MSISSVLVPKRANVRHKVVKVIARKSFKLMSVIRFCCKFRCVASNRSKVGGNEQGISLIVASVLVDAQKGIEASRLPFGNRILDEITDSPSMQWQGSSRDASRLADPL